MDINAIKERLQNLNRRSNKANDVWKPKGDHDIRCLPYPHGGDPMIDLHFHYEIGESTTILCPKSNFGDDCAVCDFCDVLKSWKGPDGQDKPENERKADFEIFKKIQPKARVFIPMVERGKEADGAKYWGVTPNQAGQILNVCTDGDRLSELGIDRDDAAKALDVIFSPTKAYDLKVSFRKPGEKGNTKTFPVVEIEGKIKATPVSKDKKEAEAILASVKNIKEVYPPMSSTEVKRMLDRWTGNQSVEAKADGATEKYETKSKESANKKGGRSIDEAFCDMVEEA